MNRVTILYTPLSIACAIAALVVPADAWAVTFTEQGSTILGGFNATARSVSLADIDNDGDLDAFFQGSASSARQIFRNDFVGSGTLAFTNVTSSMLPSGVGDSWSAGWGDYNGDGRVDVFVGQTNSSSAVGDLLRNTGSGFYNETSNNNLIPDPGFHQNIAWIDIDNDRDLDLLIGMEGPTEMHELYRHNWATHTFQPIGASVGIQVAHGTKAYGMAIGDTDSDGDLDVYISTCRSGGNIRNNFFQNMLVESGTSTLSFIDIADTNGTQNFNNTYGSEFVDFDNDGMLDLYVTGAQNDTTGVGNPTKIFKNLGGNQFVDVDTITGHELLRDADGNSVRGTDLNGGRAIDYDNDGDLDLYFHDNLASSGNQRLFKNKGNWEFEDVTVAEGLNLAAGGAPVGAGGYDSTWGDLDRDGDQDLIDPNNSTFSGNPTPERVYVSNASTNGNHWLYVDLKGPTENTTAIGASVYAKLNDGTPQELTLRREANTNAGTFNQSDLPVHFGLGAATVVDELRIQWPDGSKQSLYNVATNQYLTVQYLPGDYTGDGIVNSGDYVTWRKGLGTSYSSLDYDVWRSHFGQSSSGSGMVGNLAVPEMASGVLIVLAAFPVFIYGRWARRR
jgi:hypothetical protein